MSDVSCLRPIIRPSAVDERPLAAIRTPSACERHLRVRFNQKKIFFMGLLDTLGTGGMSSGISGAASLVDTGLNQAFAKRNARLELEQNKKLADYQYSKDLDMWNKGNLYNSPEEQMKRLKAAGLNPN